MTPAKKLVPTPSSSRIASRVVSESFLNCQADGSSPHFFVNFEKSQVVFYEKKICILSQASAVATMRSPRAGRVAKGTSPRVGGKPASKVTISKHLPKQYLGSSKRYLN